MKSNWLPPARVENLLTGLQDGACPLTEFQIADAVLGCRVVLELVAEKETARAVGQFAVFDHGLQGCYVFGLQFKFGAVQVSRALSRADDEEPFHEFLQLGVFLNVDLELFIDPALLEKSGFEEISVQAMKAFRVHFSNIVRLLALSKSENDAPWKAAARLLDLSEPSENGLGYGGASRSGSSRPEDIQRMILTTTKEIVTLGADDPEMISLMGFFEEGVGPDTISDFTTRVIINELAKITSDFCSENGVETYPISEDWPEKGLPLYVDANDKSHPFLLVPKDIVRDLSIANDWSDVRETAMLNAEIRDRVNVLLAGIAEPTVTDTKQALRGAALSSVDAFNHFLEAVKGSASNYDPVRMR